MKKTFLIRSSFDLRQQILVGDVDHDGRHPENEIDRAGRQKLDQLDRETCACWSGTTTQVAPLAMHMQNSSV